MYCASELPISYGTVYAENYGPYYTSNKVHKRVSQGLGWLDYT